MYLTLYSIRIH